MYGKDFHQWREAQEIIRQIEAEEPEVKKIIMQRWEVVRVVPYPPLTSQMPSQAQLAMQQQMDWYRRGSGVGPLGSLLGSIGL